MALGERVDAEAEPVLHRVDPCDGCRLIDELNRRIRKANRAHYSLVTESRERAHGLVEVVNTVGSVQQQELGRRAQDLCAA